MTEKFTHEYLAEGWNGPVAAILNGSCHGFQFLNGKILALTLQMVNYAIRCPAFRLVVASCQILQVPEVGLQKMTQVSPLKFRKD